MTANGHTLALHAATYRPQRAAPPLVEDISLELNAGEVMALVGPNGAGKTTILRLLSGLLTPNPGRATLDSKPLPDDLRQRARSLHYVGFDALPTFDFTVRQTVAMGRHPHRGRFAQLAAEDEELIDRALDRTNLTELSNRSVLRLSSGELRRVALARALSSEATFLLLDEPTATLDLAHAAELFQLARTLAEGGRGIILALHDIAAAVDVADRVAVIDRGRVAVQGAARTVLTPATVARVFGVRFEPVKSGLPRARIRLINEPEVTAEEPAEHARIAPPSTEPEHP